MTDFLVRKFIRDYENVEDETVRARYGILAGTLGIVCNTVLCIFKIVIGLICGLTAVAADGFNNLSDAVSSVISLVGVRLSEKPADEKHPFGHGRFEYITALIVTFLILEVAINVFKTSFGKILHPETVNFHHATVIILYFSVVVKIWLSVMNRKLGKKIDSKVLMATSKDALGDVFITLATIVSLMLYMFFKINIDGYVGCAVAIAIFINGIELARDTIEPLLGQAIDEELYERITYFVESYEHIEGTHDLIVHSYGPSRKMATIHAEVPSTLSIEEAHSIVDRIERDIKEKMKIFLVIHMDPVDMDDEKIRDCKNKMSECLESLEPKASMHDLRIINREENALLIFDLVVPYSYTDEQKKSLEVRLKEEAKSIGPGYECNITVENSYIAEKKS